MWTIQHLEGNSGLNKIIIGDELTQVEIYLFGATLTSWKVNGEEKLFVSSQAIYNGIKAIRGGIPIVFPQFSQPLKEMNQHGFARTSLFTYESHCIHKEEGGEVDGGVDGKERNSISVTLTLSQNESTMMVWPYPFKLSYTILLTNSTLTSKLSVQNTGSSSFDCHMLLHTYLAVPNIHTTTVSGFNGVTYLDKLTNTSIKETSEVCIIDQEVDRIMIGPRSKSISPVIVKDCNSDKVIVEMNMTASYNDIDYPFDVVFWNPWIEKAKSLADLGDNDYLNYVCIEPGTVSKWVNVESNHVLSLIQQLKSSSSSSSSSL